MSDEFDVIVVGAGWSGLNTARQLLKHRPRLRIAIVEARERVGGRSCSVFVDTPPSANPQQTAIDVGGGWIGPTEHRTLGLVAEMGLTLKEQVWPTMYGARQAAGGPPILSAMTGAARLSEEDVIQFDAACGALDAMALTVPVDAPWTCVNAREWDAITLAEWMKINLPRKV